MPMRRRPRHKRSATTFKTRTKCLMNSAALYSARRRMRRKSSALFQDAPSRNIALTALQGMGGIGKTVLAQALCHDEVVRDAYPDGIFWFAIGKESRLS